MYSIEEDTVAIESRQTKPTITRLMLSGVCLNDLKRETAKMTPP